MHLTLEHFDGPLDLLLYLIKAQEINIFNIPIFKICDQYLTFIRNARNLNFQEAGDYLVMASQLIEIKTNSLFPRSNPSNDIATDLEGIDDQDPRKKLVQQLLEYQTLKEAADQLNNQQILGRDLFESGYSKRVGDDYSENERPLKGDAFNLVIAFERLLLKLADRQSIPKIKVHSQRITIQQKMKDIKGLIKIEEQILLDKLIKDAPTRYEIIVMIMALLELAKLSQLILNQSSLFGPILISSGPKFLDELPS